METLTQLSTGTGPAFMRFTQINPLVLILIVAWVLVWKGMALWKAARLGHKWWFIILLVANTIGILEIIYIYFIARKYTVEEKTDGQ